MVFKYIVLMFSLIIRPRLVQNSLTPVLFVVSVKTILISHKSTPAWQSGPCDTKFDSGRNEKYLLEQQIVFPKPVLSKSFYPVVEIQLSLSSRRQPSQYTLHCTVSKYRNILGPVKYYETRLAVTNVE